MIYERTEILKRLFEDILMRDVVVRYGIKDVRSVKMLAIYLASNCGNLVTGSKLSAQLGLKTTATILEYLSFLEQCYLFFFVPKFNYSAKAQSVNPKKVYCIDTGMIRNVTLSANKDMGRMLENAVFVELRRRTKNIWYYSEAAFECDFLYGSDVVPENAVQGEKRTYRTIMIDGDEFEFSQGFTELHTRSYEEILAGRGFRISEARPCIQMVSDIRHSVPIGLKGDYHPLARLPLTPHPFGWNDMRY